jgi:acetolactate synthase-1/2/3 large subunit
MAQGYARTSWKPGICLLAPGPGVTNALTGIAEAYVDSTPLVVLSNSFDDILHLLERAFTEASTGRPRPTFIELPLDVQSTRGEPQTLKSPPPSNALLDPQQIRLTAKLLLKAERPVIIAGGGVLSARASQLVLTLSDRLGIPVSTTITAKEVIPDASPLSLGLLNDEIARNLVPKADVVLALGCRFAQRSTSSWRLRLTSRIIHVDIDPREIGKNYPVTLGIVGDVGVFMSSLLEETSGVERALSTAHLKEIENLKAIRFARYSEKLTSDDIPLKPQRVIGELSNALSGDIVITSDSGNNAWWSMLFFESKEGRRFMLPSGNVSMGFSFPAALGARCLVDKVVCITGDGGMMMQLAELATAIHEDLNIIVIAS